MFAKVAAVPPTVEVNSSCLPPPLPPPSQLSCKGLKENLNKVSEQMYEDIHLLADQGLKKRRLSKPRKIAIMYLLR